MTGKRENGVGLEIIALQPFTAAEKDIKLLANLEHFLDEGSRRSMTQVSCYLTYMVLYQETKRMARKIA